MLPSREPILPRLRELLPALRGIYVSEISLFGSVARNEADRHSDIDLLVAFDENRLARECGRALSLFHVAQVQALLEDRLKCSVGLTLRRSVSASFLERIESELQRVA